MFGFKHPLKCKLNNSFVKSQIKTPKTEKFHFLPKKIAKKFVSSKIIPTFASLSQRTDRVLSSAGSEHLPYKQRVGGSNPSAPTQVEILKACLQASFFCIQSQEKIRIKLAHRKRPFKGTRTLKLLPVVNTYTLNPVTINVRSR